MNLLKTPTENLKKTIMQKTNSVTIQPPQAY